MGWNQNQTSQCSLTSSYAPLSQSCHQNPPINWPTPTVSVSFASPCPEHCATRDPLLKICLHEPGWTISWRLLTLLCTCVAGQSLRRNLREPPSHCWHLRPLQWTADPWHTPVSQHGDEKNPQCSCLLLHPLQNHHHTDWVQCCFHH